MMQELARFVGNTYESQPRADRIRHLAEMLREELVDLLTVSLAVRMRALVSAIRSTSCCCADRE